MAKDEKEPKKNNSEEVPILLTRSKVKDYVRSQKFRCSGDFVEAFNKKVYRELKRAVKLAKANGRATLKEQDSY